MGRDGDIKIRQAKIEDMEQLCKARNNEKLFAGYLDECDGEKAHFLVAEIEETIVGFGLVYLDVTKTGKKKSHLPKLSDLYVVEGDPLHQYRTPKKLSKLTPEVIHEQETNPANEQKIYSRV